MLPFDEVALRSADVTRPSSVSLSPAVRLPAVRAPVVRVPAERVLPVVPVRELPTRVTVERATLERVLLTPLGVVVVVLVARERLLLVAAPVPEAVVALAVLRAAPFRAPDFVAVDRDPDLEVEELRVVLAIAFIRLSEEHRYQRKLYTIGVRRT